MLWSLTWRPQPMLEKWRSTMAVTRSANHQCIWAYNEECRPAEDHLFECDRYPPSVPLLVKTYRYLVLTSIHIRTCVQYQTSRRLLQIDAPLQSSQRATANKGTVTIAHSSTYWKYSRSNVNPSHHSTLPSIRVASTDSTVSSYKCPITGRKKDNYRLLDGLGTAVLPRSYA